MDSNVFGRAVQCFPVGTPDDFHVRQDADMQPTKSQSA